MFCGLVPMYVLGLAGPVGLSGSEVPLIVTLIGTLWGFFVHANVRWRFGPLEWLIHNPRISPLAPHPHRAHQPKLSSTLPWMNRIFGTHYLPGEEWPLSYGIEAEMPDTMAAQLVYPLVPRKPAPKSDPPPAVEATAT